MAALSSWTAALAAAMVVASVCTSSVSGQSELGCIANYDPNKDYFGYLTGNVTGQPFVLPINQTIVDTANDFVVSYGKSYKVARNSLRKTNYVLYQVTIYLELSKDLSSLSIHLAAQAACTPVEMDCKQDSGMEFMTLVGIWVDLKVGWLHASSCTCFHRALSQVIAL